MGKFFCRFFAFIGLLTTLAVGLSGYAFYHFAQKAAIAPKAPKEMILTLDLTGPLVDTPSESSFSTLMNYEKEPVSLFTLLRALREGAKDPRVKALVVYLGGAEPSMSVALELRDAFIEFRKSGKPTYAYASSYGSFGMGNKSILLASTLEESWVQPVGTVGLTGVGLEAPFGKAVLASMGVRAEFFQRHEYKSAMEGFTRDSFSAPAKADLESLLANIADQQARLLAENKKWDVEKTKTIIARGPYTADEALAQRLLSHVGYEDEMIKSIETVAGVTSETVGVDEYVSYLPKSKTPTPTVALITINGVISDKEGEGGMLSEKSAGDADEIATAFSDAVEDNDVKAILFRVNSPGGSPTASETIRRALVKAKESKKPIIVSMGDVAASGGYWVAMDADKIIASPASITGSIGVVGGKFVLDEMWKKIGVSWEKMSSTGNAALWSSNSAFDAFGLERVNALMDQTYKSFITNVSVARRLPLEKVGEIAKGRVYTGEQALAVGLVDKLGGIVVSMNEIKSSLNLKPDDVITLKSFPAPSTPLEELLRFVRAMAGENASIHPAFTAAKLMHQQLFAAFGGFAGCVDYCVRVEIPPYMYSIK